MIIEFALIRMVLFLGENKLYFNCLPDLYVFKYNGSGFGMSAGIVTTQSPVSLNCERGLKFQVIYRERDVQKLLQKSTLETSFLFYIINKTEKNHVR